MVQDTLTDTCLDGMVITRTWTAIDGCNDTTVTVQRIILNDTTPPEILVPTWSIIQDLMDLDSIIEIMLSQEDKIRELDNLAAESVFVQDNCDEELIPVFTSFISLSQNPAEDGFSQQRTYRWVATDPCGNTASISFTVNIIDDLVAGLPGDDVIACVELPAPDEMFPGDTATAQNIVFTESIQPGTRPGEFLVTRTWLVTDLNGNSSIHVLRLIWVPTTDLTCEIILPENVEC